MEIHSKLLFLPFMQEFDTVSQRWHEMADYPGIEPEPAQKCW